MSIAPAPARGRLLAALALVVPASFALLSARERMLPGLLGLLRDDGEYVAYARALLAGLGYVDPADPALPPADRFPIGFPLLIAAVLAGAPDWPAQLARLAWLAPASLAAYALAAQLVLLRLGGFPPLAALLAGIVLVGGSEVLGYGAFLHSDPSFAALALLIFLAVEALWRRPAGAPQPRPGGATAAWAGVGAAIAAACLLRYAGVALVVALALALLLGRRAGPALAATAGFTLVFTPWLAYRVRLGGGSYGATFAEMMPAELGEWPARAAGSLVRVLAGGPAGHFLPQAAGGGPGPWFVPGLAIGVLCAWGTWCWLRDAGPDDSRFAPLAIVATCVLVTAWNLAFVELLPTLATRLLLPVAPLLWIAAARGAADVARRSALDAGATRALAIAALLACLAAVGLDRVLVAPGERARLRALADEYEALHAAVRREVPADAVVVSPYHVMLWLHADRRGHSIPPSLVGGRVEPLAPLPMLMALEHWRAGWVVAAPPISRVSGDVAGAVTPFATAFPGVLAPRWRGARSALHRIEQAPFERVCRELRIRERNAEFERRE